MKLSIYLPVTVACLISICNCNHSYARGNDFSISDGQGEMLQIKNPLFGKKTRIIRDRLGDGFGQQKGILGGTDSEFSVLGNKMQRHKGIFGNTQTSAS